MKVYCSICGKPPEQKSACPNCGLENICSYHLYKFYSDKSDSPTGCPKCGPRCAVCGAQTALVYHNKRAICSSCLSVLKSSDSIKQLRRAELFEKIQKVLSTIFPIVGVAAGIHFGMQPETLEMASEFSGFPYPPWLVTTVSGMIGFIAGSLVAAVFNTIFKR